MPHIHTQPNQHDMTTCAYIVRSEDGIWKCLVHYHKKIQVLMQIGGHIELDETPWQAVAHELEEESGYSLGELDVLQYTADRVKEAGNITHPTPLLVNTHNVGNDHYHSDLCYGFVARGYPSQAVSDSESADLRWLTIGELKKGVDEGTVLKDVLYIYEFLIDHVEVMKLIPAADYSLDKPVSIGVTYKIGAPRQQ